VKKYESLTVDRLLAVLDGMPADSVLQGLSREVGSYRGFYDHVAIEPGEGVTAGELAAELRAKIGTAMHSYKGGEYTFKGDCYVFVAPWGDCGPSLGGFTDEGEPVVFEQGWF
jgi:hypothetical protein